MLFRCVFRQIAICSSSSRPKAVSFNVLHGLAQQIVAAMIRESVRSPDHHRAGGAEGPSFSLQPDWLTPR
jgi:hypothetical protein